MNYYRNKGQMDLSDRIAIETGICTEESFKKIAKRLRTTLTYAYVDTNHKRTAIEKAMGTTFDKDGTIKPYTVEEDAP